MEHIIIIFFIIAVLVLVIIPMWKIFNKIGEKGWKCFIPLYNCIVLYRKIWEVKYLWITIGCFFLGEFIDYISNSNILLILAAATFKVLTLLFIFKFIELLSAYFRHNSWFALGFFILPFIFLPVLGYEDNLY